MFAYPLNSNHQYPIALPPIEEFGRPIWAYNHLGWDILRRQLFGQTDKVMGQLAEHGDTLLSSAQLEGIINKYRVHDTVRHILTQACVDQPASVVYDFYAEWEEETFNHYVSQSKKRSR